MGWTSWEKNRIRDDVPAKIVCPYINREVTILDGVIFNMFSYGNMRVYETDRPVDSDWPVKKSKYFDEIREHKSNTFEQKFNYEEALTDELSKVAKDVTEEFYREAIIFIENGQYKELRKQILEQEKGRHSFFVCPFENPDVDHNYEYVIKPTIKQYHFDIQRADEISHTGTITEVIISAINRSRFIVADLTEEKPNCYYEVGYAHSIGKPVIIIAKEGTTRHFDLSAHKWTYWSDYKDLKGKFEKELQGVVKGLGIDSM